MITGILFDKDGTLFDFHQTWSGWTRALLTDLAEGQPLRAASLATAVGYDMETGHFAPDSPVIAHTPEEIALALLPQLPGKSLAALVSQMNTLSATAPTVQAVPLVPLMARLRREGLKLGVVTNDAEGAARAQLAQIGAEDSFDYVAGFDSGHGGKPSPGMLLAFARAHGLDPAGIAMVGDSRHDLVAGRAAGMRCIGVLTGPAREEDLAPLAEAVLPDIGYLPGWVDAQLRVES
ncbi:HAD family hydrolase [Solirhodobacter olei]|uniref:HAD family hydrolase n=1 Tax=Solirhodobacter olei TaxID=2493082 RepID=UPI000FDCB4E6|nr:HAD family hydrolase [Solirhodobacter olei]